MLKTIIEKRRHEETSEVSMVEGVEPKQEAHGADVKCFLLCPGHSRKSNT